MPDHGMTRYRQGCRCQTCRKANADTQAAYRERPYYHQRQNASQRARGRALTRLSRAHQAEYERLYAEELMRESSR